MNNVREQFPIFKSNQLKRLAYLDSAASSQKPKQVIEAIGDFYSDRYANIHRGAYSLSAKATDMYEEARSKIASFIGSKHAESVIFTRNATESINLVAKTFAGDFETGDCILLSELEHHSNIVPWQLLAEEKKLKLDFVKIDSKANLDLDDFENKLLKLKPKLLAITMHSNAFGTVLPIESIVEKAHKNDCLVLLDASQSVVHSKINVSKLNPDFLVFSGHKLYGPTGSGVLYARKELLESMTPFLGGGDMIQSVSLEGSVWADLPNKFEAGTPSIAEAIGLGVAIDFVNSIGHDQIQEQDAKLTQMAFDILGDVPDVELYGPLNLEQQSSILAFNVNGIHAHDFATIADSHNVQVRAGFHCAMPALKALGLSSTARLSFGVYSEEQDLLQLRTAILEAKKIFKNS